MRTAWSFTQTSIVPAPAPAVWERAVAEEGINDERRPWLSMSLPRGAARLTIDNIKTRRPLGRAWLRPLGPVLTR